MVHIKRYNESNSDRIHDFNIGDIVTCIKAFDVNDPYLFHGGIYKLTLIRDNMVGFRGNFVEWFTDRFRLATAEECERYEIENDANRYNL